VASTNTSVAERTSTRLQMPDTEALGQRSLTDLVFLDKECVSLSFAAESNSTFSVANR